MQSPAVVSTIKRIVTNRRTALLAVEVVVLIWSIVELVSLAIVHISGPEVYGVFVAAVAVLAAAVSAALLASTRRRILAAAAVLVLWAVVAIGGIAGTVAHATGVGPEFGPVDARARPAGAPLIFTALGLVGGTVLVYGQRSGAARVREP